MRVCYLRSGAGSLDGGMYLTTFVINDVLAVDAGCIGHWATATEQARITDVILTHSHLDHVGSLPMFLDNTCMIRSGPVRIHASVETLHALRNRLFTSDTWVDLATFTDSNPPMASLVRMESGKDFVAAGLSITPVPVTHAVPNLGLLIRDEHATIAIPSDTGPTDEFWRVASREKSLRAVFLECSFPDRLSDLAIACGHLTPSLFREEIAKLNREIDVYAVHIKPAMREEVTEELSRIDMPRLQIVEPGLTYEF